MAPFFIGIGKQNVSRFCLAIMRSVETDMASQLNPYLGFPGNAREAMTFYQSVFGGELDMLTFAQGGMPPDSENADQLMHAHLRTEDGYQIMGSDGMDSSSGGAISIAITGSEKDKISAFYAKLCEGGDVIEPLAEAPWGGYFGMCNCKFGHRWMFNISPEGS